MSVTTNLEVEVNNLLTYLKGKSVISKVGMANYNEVTVEKLALVQAIAVIETLLLEKEQKQEYKCPPVIVNTITPRCYGIQNVLDKYSSSCMNCQHFTDCVNEVESLEDLIELYDVSVESKVPPKTKKAKQPSNEYSWDDENEKF